MKSVKPYVIGALTLVMVASAGLLIYPGLQSAEADNRRYENKFLKPIVQAKQFGFWDVKVNNSPDMPVPVVVQGGNGECSEKTIVEITKRVLGERGRQEDVYTVSPGKKLVITDVIIQGSVFSSGGGCCAEILRNSLTVSRVEMQNSTRMYQRLYKTGIEFREGDTVSVGGGVDLFYELRGYLEDA